MSNALYRQLSDYDLNPAIESNILSLELELLTIYKFFPKLTKADFDREFIQRICSYEVKLPKGAERWTLIPNWERASSTYGDAVEKILALAGFFNHKAGELGPERLRQQERTVRMLDQVSKIQKSDILIIPVQLGEKNAGISVTNVRNGFEENEFGLDSFTTGVIMLTHLKKLEAYEDFWADCAGDEYAAVDGSFTRAPSYSFSDGGLRYDTHRTIHAIDGFGSPSGFVPQIRL